MTFMRRLWPLLLLLIAVSSVRADEGMWLLNELNKQNLERMKELGFNLPYDSLLKVKNRASLSQAVVIFGGGCTGIAVSEEGLIFYQPSL